MNLTPAQELTIAWVALSRAAGFALFGYDKWQSGRGGARVAELTLCLVSALGGWPGGLAAILLFRHKSAKGTFQIKFTAAFVVWALLLAVVWQFEAGGLAG